MAYCPRTCLAGLFSAVAAQMSESLPLSPRVSTRPIPPAAAQQRLLNARARARAAAGDEEPEPEARGARTCTEGLNGRGGARLGDPAV